MLLNRSLPHQKRHKFRNELESGKLLRFVGAYSPLIALLVEKIGFEGVYISGGVLANDLGYPDIGLTTLPEVTQRGRQIARVTTLPALIDIDTGFGETLNVARTIQELEEMGLCACHIEDQVATKRCGHLDNKQLIDRDHMCEKIKAAVEARRDENFMIMARCDARAVESLDDAIDRMNAYIDAGADMIFPEALKDKEEFEQVRKHVDVPLLANMTEFGKTDLMSQDELGNMGYNLVIYPVTSQRLAVKAVEDGLREIFEKGTQENILDKMQSRQKLYDLLRYEEYNQFDKQIYNFKL